MDERSSQDNFSHICVFCGSSSGKKAIYTEVAQQLGVEMVKRNIDLVYGGGSIGLMGTVAKTVQDNGGHVVGVIPRALMPKEICGATFGDLVAVDDMHQRKAEMARRADAFIALPGGFGTFEEVLEIITWAQLGILTKPVGLLNVDGYYDAMLALFDKAFEEGFLNLASRNIVVSAPTADALLDGLKNYTPTIDKSVPQLTWDTTTTPSSSKPKVDPTSAVYKRGFPMDLQSARTVVTKRGITKMKLGACHHYPMHAQEGFKSGLSRSSSKRPREQQYDLKNFKQYASMFARNEEKALKIKIKEVNSMSQIFPRYSDVEIDSYLNHLKLEGYNHDQVLTFNVVNHPELNDNQRRFLTKLRRVVKSNEVDNIDAKCELYVQDMVDVLLQQCKLDDALHLEMLSSLLKMNIAGESFATQSDKEGRIDDQLVWVLQESKQHRDTRYRGGEIQLVSAIIAACQHNYRCFRARGFPQIMYGINIRGDEVSVMRTVVSEQYLLELYEGLPRQTLAVKKYPKDAGLRLSSYESRCEILSIMTKLRKYALSINMDVLNSS